MSNSLTFNCGIKYEERLLPMYCHESNGTWLADANTCQCSQGMTWYLDPNGPTCVPDKYYACKKHTGKTSCGHLYGSVDGLIVSDSVNEQQFTNCVSLKGQSGKWSFGYDAEGTPVGCCTSDEFTCPIVHETDPKLNCTNDGRRWNYATGTCE